MSTEILEIEAAMQGLWDSCKFEPTRIYLSTGQFVRFARMSMRKRQFRRWRGRFLAQMRREWRNVVIVERPAS